MKHGEITIREIQHVKYIPLGSNTGSYMIIVLRSYIFVENQSATMLPNDLATELFLGNIIPCANFTTKAPALASHNVPGSGSQKAPSSDNLDGNPQHHTIW